MVLCKSSTCVNLTVQFTELIQKTRHKSPHLYPSTLAEGWEVETGKSPRNVWDSEPEAHMTVLETS